MYLSRARTPSSVAVSVNQLFNVEKKKQFNVEMFPFSIAFLHRKHLKALNISVNQVFNVEMFPFSVAFLHRKYLKALNIF